LLWQYLAPTMRKHVAWRQPVPVFSERPFSGIPFPAATEAFIAARLAELRDLVNSWTPATFATTFFSSVSEFNLPPGPVETEAPVRRTDCFEVPDSITCVPVEEAGTDKALHLFSGNRRLSMPLAALPFIQHLARHKKFRADEGLRWDDSQSGLAWSDVREALEVLLDSGVIRRSHATPSYRKPKVGDASVGSRRQAGSQRPKRLQRRNASPRR